MVAQPFLFQSLLPQDLSKQAGNKKIPKFMHQLILCWLSLTTASATVFLSPFRKFQGKITLIKLNGSCCFLFVCLLCVGAKLTLDKGEEEGFSVSP